MRPEAGQEGQGDLGLGAPGLTQIPALPSPCNLWQIAFPSPPVSPSAKCIPQLFPISCDILDPELDTGNTAATQEADTEGQAIKKHRA